MAMSVNPAGSGPPPGTVELLAAHGGTGEDGSIVLNPTPSDDPEDPLRWPMWRKCLNYTIIIALSTANFTALSTQPLFWVDMAKDMTKTTLEDLANAQAAQLVGLAVGCIIFMPLATKYGLRSNYIIMNMFACAASWWSAYMNTVPELYGSNFLFGIAGSINQTTIAMTINDIWFVHQRGTANGMFFLGTTVGAFLVPIAAGLQSIRDGWRLSYASLAIALTVLLVITIIALEETKFIRPLQTEMTIQDKDAMFKLESFESELARGPSNEKLHIPRNKRGCFVFGFLRRAKLQFITKSDESIWKVLYSPLKSWWFPHVLFASIELGSSICWLVTMGSMSSILFSAPPYNFDAAGLGYMTLGPFVGAVLGSIYGGYLTDKAIIWLSKRNKGWFEPEMRLWLYPLPALTMAGGLILFGISAARGMHFIVPSVGGALFGFSFGAISDIATGIVIDSFPDIVPQTFVVLTFLRNVISMASPFSVVPWFDSMGASNMFIMSGCLSLAINLLALPMGIWGKKSRAAVAGRYYHLTATVA
ncbi:major facilitator superfamily transporter [Ophiocordyceps camponoti-floridani]|uniref:Major facilitator superfamily transporter n=1 Tax=Ophiocordyceps camponoti-floridani TaxID=2030778 RepID=A0A8H4VBX4_9HYPO|nr:major facilitator superfamily transporter [Ophiocordyceps camponoti-floridani]